MHNVISQRPLLASAPLRPISWFESAKRVSSTVILYSHVKQFLSQPMSNIHPTAIIEDGAQVDPSSSVGPYSIIESGAVVGPDCVIESSVRIFSPVTMGRGNRVCHGTVLGCEPQDLGFTPELGKPLTIGDHNHFKEGVNLRNRSFL